MSPPPGNFESYLVPHVLSVSPASGSEVGGTIVTVSGDSFTSAFRNQCRWGGAVTNITWFSTPGTVVNEGASSRAHRRRATLASSRSR